MYTIFSGQSVPWQSSNRRPGADFGQKRVLDEEAPGKLCGPPQKTVTDKNRRKAPDFGFRLHDAPHMGDMDENNPKHYWISQLLVVPDVFHFDSLCTFRLLKPYTSCGGAIGKSVVHASRVL